MTAKERPQPKNEAIKGLEEENRILLRDLDECEEARPFGH